MKVVYVDVLFLINLCMDFLALYIAGGVLNLKRQRLPLLFSAAIGGVYAVLTALYPGNATVGILIGIAVSILLCFVAYGKNAGMRSFSGVCALFYGVSWLLGGMIGAFYGLLSRFFRDREDLYLALTDGDGRLAIFFAIAGAAATLIGLFKRHFTFRRQERTVTLSLSALGRRTVVSALVDSGNLLADPLSGRPCIVLHPDAAQGLLPRDVLAFWETGGVDPSVLGPATARRIRLIPAETVGGRDLLVGYLPDRIEVLGDTGRVIDALLVLGRGGEPYAGNAALIPSVLA